MANTTSRPVQCVIYRRVSTGKQRDSGLGLEAQLEKCEEHARRKGYEVIGRFVDEAVSGKDAIEGRPGLQEVLKLAPPGSGVVVVLASLSRLSRRQSLTWMLLDDRGAFRLQVESATEPFETTSPMGRAMLGMLAVWAQLEADMCSERTVAALSARRARGYKLGPKTLAEENPATVRMVQELYRSGEWTHRTLAEEMNRRGVPTKLGKRWHATQIARTLGQTVATTPAAG